MTKSASASVVDVGDTLVYTLRYANAGNQTATTVRLTDTLPANLTVIATSPAADVQTAQQLAWNVGTLNAGAQGQVVITTTVGGACGQSAAQRGRHHRTSGELSGARRTGYTRSSGHVVLACHQKELSRRQREA